MTFGQLQKANEQIQTTDIKGKNYAEVNQRIKAFRMCYPDGFITTTLKSNEDGVCIFRASVGYYDNEGREFVLGIGTAYEKEGSTFINKTSYIENCETSAVGRALGMAGFGIDTSVASYEEVQTAIINQNKKPEVDPVESEYPKVFCPECGIQMLKMTTPKGKVWTPEQILKKYGMCENCYKKHQTDKIEKLTNEENI